MGNLGLSKKERYWLEVMSKVRKGGISLGKAAELLGVSYRQVLRIWQRFGTEGNLGLKHGLRGRPSNRQIESGRRERVLKLYEAKYGDFGPTLALEYLRKVDGEDLSKETLRGWLVDAGSWRPRRRCWSRSQSRPHQKPRRRTTLLSSPARHGGVLGSIA